MLITRHIRLLHYVSHYVNTKNACRPPRAQAVG